jgi:hypothetical protein
MSSISAAVSSSRAKTNKTAIDLAELHTREKTIEFLGADDELLIPEQAAHLFRDDAAHPFRLIVARHSD